MKFSVQTEKTHASASAAPQREAQRAGISYGGVKRRGDVVRYAPLFYLSTLSTLVCLSLALPSIILQTGTTPVAPALAALLAHGLALGLLSVHKKARWAALVSSTAALSFISWAVAYTGGITSPLLVLFALPIIEAFLTRRQATAHAVIAMGFIGFVGGIGLAGHEAVGAGATPLPMEPYQLVLLAMFGVLYAFTLAARILRTGRLKDVQAHAARRAINQFHAITHDVFLILRRDGHAKQVFGAVEETLDCPAHAIKGAGFIHRVHISDRPVLLSTLDLVHATCGRDTVEARIRAGEDGAPQRFIWAEIDISVAQGSSSEPEIYAMIRDISAVKERAAEMTLAREKAEASDAAKGRFLATMSHELRTPLNAIIGFADILEEEVFGPLANDQQREYVGLVRESGGHLLQLVNDLLDMSKLDAGHFHIVAEPFAVHTVVERCTRLVGQQIEKAGLKLTVDVPEKLPELVADQRAIRQVLINLLSNASKFTPEGGSITLRARQDGNFMVLTVADSGIGIATHELGKLGEPFFQANNAYDRAHQGTGLGLSVVKGLCELHEGKLSFSSVEGEGTTVTVKLPLAGPRRTGNADPAAANTVVLAKLHNEREANAGSTETRAAPLQQPEAETFPDADVFADEQPQVLSGEAEDYTTQATEGRRAHG